MEGEQVKLEEKEVKAPPEAYSAIVKRIRTHGIIDASQVSALLIVPTSEIEALDAAGVSKVRILLNEEQTQYSAMHENRQVDLYPAAYIDDFKKAVKDWLGKKYGKDAEFVYYWWPSSPLIVVASSSGMGGSNSLVMLIAPRFEA